MQFSSENLAGMRFHVGDVYERENEVTIQIGGGKHKANYAVRFR